MREALPSFTPEYLAARKIAFPEFMIHLFQKYVALVCVGLQRYVGFIHIDP